MEIKFVSQKLIIRFMSTCFHCQFADVPFDMVFHLLEFSSGSVCG